MPSSPLPPDAAQPAPPGGLRVSPLGDTRARYRTRAWLLLAFAAIAAGPLWLWLHAEAPTEDAAIGQAPTGPVRPLPAPNVAAAPPASGPAARTRATAAHPAQVLAPSSTVDDTDLPSLDPNDLAAYIRPGDPEPTAAEVIRGLQEAGIHEGLGAFNPPGTVPLMPGIVVPEGFVLPPGYVRHYQVTDEGEMLPPVLMFSPDHDWRDAGGRPLPDDRLVPPEMAPPGMPIHPLPLPEPPRG